MYEVPAATPAESAAIATAAEEGNEPLCPRHARPTPVRKRGRQFVCPACGVVFDGGE
jgi:hypothetical protein